MSNEDMFNDFFDEDESKDVEEVVKETEDIEEEQDTEDTSEQSEIVEEEAEEEEVEEPAEEEVTEEQEESEVEEELEDAMSEEGGEDFFGEEEAEEESTEEPQEEEEDKVKQALDVEEGKDRSSKATPKQEESGRWDLSDDRGEGTATVTIYGEKGGGKTTLACALEGTKYIVSMDRKAVPVKDSLYNGDDSIIVKNGVRYYSEATGETKIKTADETYEYILHGLLQTDAKNEKPDWIVFDDSDKLVEICGMRMRYRNGKGPYEGIANLNIWKQRKDYIRTLHKTASDIAKKGVVYTCFTEEKKIIEEGSFVTRKDIPAWFDIIMKRTDALIRVQRNMEEDHMQFLARVETAKKNGIVDFETGTSADVTGIYDKPDLMERLK